MDKPKRLQGKGSTRRKWLRGRRGVVAGSQDARLSACICNREGGLRWMEGDVGLKEYLFCFKWKHHDHIY